jgi:FkbM family methyltransferase
MKLARASFGWRWVGACLLLCLAAVSLRAVVVALSAGRASRGAARPSALSALLRGSGGWIGSRGGSSGACGSSGDGGLVAGFDFAAMARALYNRSRFADQEAAEALIAAQLPPAGSTPRYHLAARFPLPELPVFVALADGTCLLGHCEPEMTPGAATWNPDAHIRDLISSVLLPCALRFLPDDCLTLDIGSNFGLHALAALRLGARVVGVEPQTDLCVAARASAAANGWAARSLFLCGGVAAAADAPRDARLTLGAELYRYQGPRSVPHYALPASVPLYTLAHLVDGFPAGAFFRLVKIDTDSIDCAVLGQVVALVQAGRIAVGAFFLESWDHSCRANGAADLAAFLWWAHTSGYTVYRTHITERSWDADHQDTAAQFAPLPGRPPIFREQFCQRFNLNLWVLDDANVTADALAGVVATQTQYQYFATTDPFVLAGYVTAAQ